MAEIIKEKSPGAAKQLTIKQPTTVPTEWISYKFKVIILGDFAVGKTSLISRFQGKGFQTATQITTGVDRSIFSVRAGESYVNLEMWDTGGQERFFAIARSSYNDKVVVLLIGNKFDLSGRSREVNFEEGKT